MLGPWSSALPNMANVDSFPTYFRWKTIVFCRIREFEVIVWDMFITDYPDLYIVQACLGNTISRKFWSVSEQFPDLVCCLHTQVRLMGRPGLNGGILWLKNTESALCFICKQENETPESFSFCMYQLCRHFDLLWSNLVSKINNSNPTDGCPHVAPYESQSTSQNTFATRMPSFTI